MEVKKTGKQSHEALWKDAHMDVTNYQMLVSTMTIPLLIKHINAVRFVLKVQTEHCLTAWLEQNHG